MCDRLLDLLQCQCSALALLQRVLFASLAEHSHWASSALRVVW